MIPPLAEVEVRPVVGDELELTCERLVHRGLGLCHHQGQVVFVFGALPGERVRVRVTAARARHLRADVIEVQRPAEGRVVPPCPVFGVCGGCQLQHAAYPLQLEAKRGVLEDELDRRGLALPADTRVVGSRRPYGYRWRGEFHRGAGGRLGFTSRHGYQNVPVSDCPIHRESINAALSGVGRALEGEGAQARTVSLTAVDEGVLVQVRPDSGASSRVALAAAEEGGPLLGTESGALDYLGRSFRTTANSFIQVNQETLPDLYEPVLEWLGPEVDSQLVVDAYAGSGVLSVRLADLGAQVVAVESNPTSARLAQLHAQMYGGGRVEVRRGEVEEELPRLRDCRAVVLDPPRSGLAPQVRGWLSLAGPKMVAYLSCEVSALGRDLETLCRLGPYRLERLLLVDMFPQTYHFEVAAMMRRS
ncbi:MAG: TRAM domain-containing protein [Candidatus Dormiibacterota bacterium]